MSGKKKTFSPELLSSLSDKSKYSGSSVSDKTLSNTVGAKKTFDPIALAGLGATSKYAGTAPKAATPATQPTATQKPKIYTVTPSDVAGFHIGKSTKQESPTTLIQEANVAEDEAKNVRKQNRAAFTDDEDTHIPARDVRSQQNQKRDPVYEAYDAKTLADYDGLKLTAAYKRFQAAQSVYASDPTEENLKLLQEAAAKVGVKANKYEASTGAYDAAKTRLSAEGEKSVADAKQKAADSRQDRIAKNAGLKYRTEGVSGEDAQRIKREAAQAITTEKQDATAARLKENAYKDVAFAADYSNWMDVQGKNDFAAKSKYTPTRISDKKSKTHWSYDEGIYSADTGASAFKDAHYDAINGDADALNEVRFDGFFSLDNKYSYADLYEQMTPNEVSVYNYYYRTSKTKAQEWIDFLTPTLVARSKNDTSQQLKTAQEQNPFLMSVANTISSTLAQPMAALNQNIGNLASTVTGEVDPRSGRLYDVAMDPRNVTSQYIAEKGGKWGSFGYGVATSLLDQGLTRVMSAGLLGDTAAAGKLVQTLMSSNAMASTTEDALNRGLSLDQATTLGLLSGFIEYATEKYSVGAWLDKTTLDKSVGGYILKNALAEGLEEGASNLANIAADVLVSQDANKWKQDMRALKASNPGMTEDEAFRKVFLQRAEELGFDMLAGFVSGGAMGSVQAAPAIPGAIADSARTAKLKRSGELNYPGVQDGAILYDPETGLIRTRATAPVDIADSPKYTDTKAKDGTTVLSEAATAFVNAGMRADTAQKKAEVVRKLVAGEEVSELEINTLEPTNPKRRALFSELTGVQFPEGKLSPKQLYDLYRSAAQVAQTQVAETVAEMPAEEAHISPESDVQQTPTTDIPAAETSDTEEVSESVLNRMREANEDLNPEFQDREADVQENLRNVVAALDMDKDGNRLATQAEFLESAKDYFPDMTERQLKAEYKKYRNGSRTVLFNGERMTRTEFGEMLRSELWDENLTNEQVDTLFNLAVLSTLDGVDAYDAFTLTEAELETKRTGAQQSATNRERTSRNELVFADGRSITREGFRDYLRSQEKYADVTTEQSDSLFDAMLRAADAGQTVNPDAGMEQYLKEGQSNGTVQEKTKSRGRTEADVARLLGQTDENQPGERGEVREAAGGDQSESRGRGTEKPRRDRSGEHRSQAGQGSRRSLSRTDGSQKVSNLLKHNPTTKQVTVEAGGREVTTEVIDAEFNKYIDGFDLVKEMSDRVGRKLYATLDLLRTKGQATGETLTANGMTANGETYVYHGDFKYIGVHEGGHGYFNADKVLLNRVKAAAEKAIAALAKKAGVSAESFLNTMVQEHIGDQYLAEFGPMAADNARQYQEEFFCDMLAIARVSGYDTGTAAGKFLDAVNESVVKWEQEYDARMNTQTESSDSTGDRALSIGEDATAQKSTTDDDGAKFSLKNKNLTGRSRIPFTTLTGYIAVAKGDSVALGKLDNAVKGIKKGTYENDATGYRADITSDTIRKAIYPTAQKFDRYEGRYIRNLNAMLMLPELFEKAVYVDSKPPQKTKNANKQIKEYHHFVAPVLIGTDTYRAIITARAKVNSDTLYVLKVEVLPMQKKVHQSAAQQKTVVSQFKSVPSDISIPELVNGVKIHDYITGVDDVYAGADVKFGFGSDSDYLAAVNRGDMATAQKMVDEAAKAAGFDVKAYHGTDASFTEFDTDLIYFTANKNHAKEYGGKVLQLYVKSDKPYVSPDGVIRDQDGEPFLDGGEEVTVGWLDAVPEALDYLIANKYDAAWDKDMDFAAVFSRSKVKSADPVTYDDNGNVIPLSKRFDSSNDGIRFSVVSTAEAAGLEATRDEKTGMISFRDASGNAVTKVTAEHIKNESGLGTLIAAAEAQGFITAKDAEIQYESVAKIMNMIMKTQDPDLVWAWAGSSLFSAVKSNADGQYGTTVDFSTICRKTQDMITAMSSAMKKAGRGLTKDEVVRLQKKIFNNGLNVPCPVCYVFSRWAGVGSLLDNMQKWQNKYRNYSEQQIRDRIEELQTAVTGKGSTQRKRVMLREQDSYYDLLASDKESLMQEKRELNASKKTAAVKQDPFRTKQIELRIKEIESRLSSINAEMKEMEKSTTPELAWLKNVRLDSNYKTQGDVPANVLFDLDNAAAFAKDYPVAWKYRTTRGPSAGKAILPYSDMRLGDLILGPGKNSANGQDVFKNTNGEFTPKQREAFEKALARTKAQNLIGGQRFQSTSDFRYDYALDYMMAFWEAQALGSNVQTYTKVIEFADWIAAVGGDANLSVMGKNQGYVTLPDGTKRLEFSSVTGISFEAAKIANDKYDNVQLVLVGINDEHIRLALDDNSKTGGEYIGFVIPYHASGASITDFISHLVENLNEKFLAQYYKDYSDVQGDKVKDKATADQKRRADLRSKLLRGKESYKKADGNSASRGWEPTADDIAFISRESKDITDRSFEELREIELKALKGDKAAIAEYESWTAGALRELHEKLWTNESSEYHGTRLNTAQSKTIMPHEYWNKNTTRQNAYINGFLFRSYCYNLGLKPRFSGDTKMTYGDFTNERGYWKLLIDRPMYRNDGTYRDQQKVSMTNFNQELLTPDYTEKNWAGYGVQEPDTAKAKQIGEEFVEETKFSTADDGKQEAISFAEALEQATREVAESKGMTSEEYIDSLKEVYGDRYNDGILQRRLATEEQRMQEDRESQAAEQSLREAEKRDAELGWEVWFKKNLRAAKQANADKVKALREQAKTEKSEALKTQKEIAKAEKQVALEKQKAEMIEALKSKDLAWQIESARRTRQAKAAEKTKADERVQKVRQKAIEDARKEKEIAKAEKQVAIEKTRQHERLMARKQGRLFAYNLMKADHKMKNAAEVKPALTPSEQAETAPTTFLTGLRNLAVRTAKQGSTWAYSRLVNDAMHIDAFAKFQKGFGNADAMVNQVRNAEARVGHIMTQELVDPKTNERIGVSGREALLCLKSNRRGKQVLDKAKQALLQRGLLVRHHIDRMSLEAKAQQRIEDFVAKHPGLAKMKTSDMQKIVALTEKEAQQNGLTKARDILMEYFDLVKQFNETKNKAVLGDGKNPISVEAAQAELDTLLQENPWLEEKMDGVYEWWDAFMRAYVAGTLVSQESYEHFREMYPHYVPTFRAKYSGAGSVSKRSANIGTSTPIKSATGSIAEVQSIELSFLELTRKFVKQWTLETMFGNMVDSVLKDTDGDFAGIAWLVDDDGKPLSIESTDGKELTEAETLGDGEEEGLTEVREERNVTKVGGDWYLTFRNGGSPIRIGISKELAWSLQQLTGTHELAKAERMVTSVGRAITGIPKMFITGINPAFAIRNVAKDLPTAVYNTTATNMSEYLKNYGYALTHIKRNSKEWRDFAIMGGTGATQLANESGLASKDTAKMLSKAGKLTAKDLMQIPGEYLEAVPRFAEYLSTIQRLGDTYEGRVQAIKDAAEITVDFSRHGSAGKVINSFCLYWNPKVQGLDKAIRQTLDTRDGRALAKHIFTYFGRVAAFNIIAEGFMYAVLKALGKYDEWEELDDRTKDTYYCFPRGEYGWINIKRSEFWGTVIGVPIMRTIAKLEGREKAFENYLRGSLGPNVSPVPGARDIPVVSQWVDSLTNKDFAGRTIVPQSMDGLEAKDKYTTDTSYLARALGTALNTEAFSPILIDHYMESLFSDWGSLAIQATSEATWTGDRNFGHAAWDIISSPFTADTRYNNAAVSKYYDTIGELESSVKTATKRHEDLMARAEKTSDPDAYIRTNYDRYDFRPEDVDGLVSDFHAETKNVVNNSKEKQTLDALDKLYGNDIQDLNAEARNLPKNDEKDRIKGEIAELAAAALNYYDQCVDGTISNPKIDATYSAYSAPIVGTMEELDAYSSQYNFEPNWSPAKTYTDPRKDGYEYILTDDQKDYAKTLYIQVYEEMFAEETSRSRYKKASGEEKAAILEGMKADVLEEVKDELFRWLRKSGVKSTKKQTKLKR